MKTTTRKPRVTKKKDSVSILFRFNGQDTTLSSNNVLEALRGLEINPIRLKTRVLSEFSFNGHTFRRAFSILQFRQLLNRDINRQVVAKFINQALGIHG